MVVPTITPPPPPKTGPVIPKRPKVQYDHLLNLWMERYGGRDLYPSRDEKEKLAIESNITYTQVNRWFANRRRKQKLRGSSASPSSSNTDPLEQPCQSPGQEMLTINSFWNEGVNPFVPQSGQTQMAKVIDSNNNSGVHEPKCQRLVPDPLASATCFDKSQCTDSSLLFRNTPIMRNPVELVTQMDPRVGQCPTDPFLNGFVAGGVYPPASWWTAALSAGLPLWQHALGSQMMFPPPPPNPLLLNGLTQSQHRFLTEQQQNDALRRPQRCANTSTPASSPSKSELILLDSGNLTEEESIAVSVLAEFALQRHN